MENEALLDSLLTQWTERHRLPDAQADAIRNAILATPLIETSELPVIWWQTFFASVGVTVAQAAHARRDALQRLTMRATGDAYSSTTSTRIPIVAITLAARSHSSLPP